MSRCLVDATVWAKYLRGTDRALKDRLDARLDENLAVTSGIVLTELLAGTSREMDRRLLEECFRGLPYLEATRDVFAAAGQMGADLRRQGEDVPLADLLLLALAREHCLTLYTFNDRLAALARAQGVALEAPSAASPSAPVRSGKSASQRGG